MPTLPNQRQELFCQYLAAGRSATAAAIEAGYSVKTASQIASRLLTFVKVLARKRELQAEIAQARIMTEQERRERLSEIGRGRVTDFFADGKITIGKNSSNVGAIESVTKRTRKAKDAIISEEVTEVNLYNPVAAIQELNKMDHVYSETTGVVNNIQITEVVMVRPEER